MDPLSRSASQNASSTTQPSNDDRVQSQLGRSDPNAKLIAQTLSGNILGISGGKTANETRLLDSNATKLLSSKLANADSTGTSSQIERNESDNYFKQEINSLRQNLSQASTVRRQHYSATSQSVRKELVDNGDSSAATPYSFNRATILSALEMEENDIIREALYSLQGINGDRIHFFVDEKGSQRTSIKSAVLNLSLPPDCVTYSRLGSGAKDALSICCEAGCLYIQVQSYIEKQNYMNISSCVARAFACALSSELASYQNFLVQLEQNVYTAPNANNHNKSIRTLREIFVAIQAPLHRLKTLTTLTDALSYQTSKGNIPCPERQAVAPVILTALYRHLRGHGDTRHASVLHALLQAASRPWFDMLYEWCTEGRLSDPANEFFVTTTTASMKQTDGTTNFRYLWQDGYVLDLDKVPSGFLDPDLVELVFVVGKGINYIRKCLQDGEWSVKSEHLLNDNIDKEDMEGSDPADTIDSKIALGFSYSQPSSSTIPSFQNSNYILRRTLEASALLVHSHILNSLKYDYNLMQHLYALKQFLLLGQGDFFSALMHGLHAEYETNKTENNGNKGIIGIYRHTLAAVVESSLRSTNAISFSHDILERLQVDLLLDKDDDARYMFGTSKAKARSNDDRTIWDVFLLRYILPDPLVAVVHNSAMDCYKRMFLLLFSLKRVEFLLNLTWRQSAVLQHALHLQAQYMGISVESSPQYAKANVLLRQIAMTRQSMMHFVGNLKSYLMFEVLEGGWRELVNVVDEARTLDEVIQAHDNYLIGICRKSLLFDSIANMKGSEFVPDLLGKLEKPLSLADEFCTYQESLFGDAQQAADLAAEKRREVETRLNQGDWGCDDIENEEETFFGLSDGSKLEELDHLSKDFNHHIYELLKALDSKLNEGPAWAPSNDTSFSSPTSFRGRHENQEALSDQDDLDSLRFLIFQLDNNKYYGVTQV